MVENRINEKKNHMRNINKKAEKESNSDSKIEAITEFLRFIIIQSLEIILSFHNFKLEPLVISVQE